MSTNTVHQLAVSDLSPHVVQLAREIDRLVPGTYEITVSKGELRQQDWQFEIIRKEKVSSGSLSSRKYQSE